MNTTPPFPRTRIAVVIPCYRVANHILGVVGSIPVWIDCIFAVDDACPEKSGLLLQTKCGDARLRVIFHTANQGVGGATASGYAAAIAAQCDIVVKMDGDGQMDPGHLSRLLQPIISGKADFTKGNRFYDLRAIRQMPLVRRIGNLSLTLFTKIASGNWHVSDPTNGYTAIHQATLKLLNLDRLSPRYFFETSMLIHLNIVRAVAVDVPIPAAYGSEKSSLNVWRALFDFPPRLLGGLIERIFWRYFIYDINAVTVFLVTGALLTTGGVGFGLYRWFMGYLENRFQSPGTVALALLPTILGVQLLLQAVLLDVVDKPVNPLSQIFKDDLKKSLDEAGNSSR